MVAADAVRMIGFKSTLPLGDLHRTPNARCKAQHTLPECRQARGIGPAAAAYDKEMISKWHRLIALFAHVTDRVAVLPLFECASYLLPLLLTYAATATFP